MQPELEPIGPREALESYLIDRSGDLRTSTLRSHRSRLSIFIEWGIEEENIQNLNNLTGRTIHRYKIWRRNEGDLSKATMKTQIDTVRVFIKWLEAIEGCPPDLHAKIKSPSLSPDENTRESELHTERAEQVLTYLAKYEYASLRHVTLALLWHTMMRAGGLRALDVEDYNREEQFLALVDRPETGTQLKNGTSGQRLVGLSEDICMVIDDYLRDQRPNVTDEHGREPLVPTREGRISSGTIRKVCYAWSRPCVIGLDCPHGRDPDTCEAAVYTSKASQCPSSEASHAFRRGGITHFLANDVLQDVVSNRADVSPDVLDKHYDERSAKDRMEQRRQYLDQL
jgi:site-specific recombinase XerD